MCVERVGVFGGAVTAPVTAPGAPPIQGRCLLARPCSQDCGWAFDWVGTDNSALRCTAYRTAHSDLQGCHGHCAVGCSLLAGWVIKTCGHTADLVIHYVDILTVSCSLSDSWSSQTAPPSSSSPGCASATLATSKPLPADAI